MADVKSLQLKIGVEGGDKAAATLDKVASSAENADESARKLPKTFDDIQAKAQRLSAGMASVGTSMSVAITAPITLAMGFATKAFADAEKGDARLRAAIQLTGGVVDQSFSKYQAFASSIQEITDVDDDAVKSLITLGLQMGISSDQIEESTKGAIGLSKAFGLDLSQAMKLTALANEGQYDMLGRYIPALRTAKTESEKMEIVQKAMATGFKLAEAEGKTFSGSMAKLKNDIGDLGEQFGAIIAGALLPMVKYFNDIILKFQSLDETTKKVIVVLGLAAAAIGPLLLMASKLINAVITIKDAMVVLDGAAVALKGTFVGMAAPAAALLATFGTLVAVHLALKRAQDQYNATMERGKKITSETTGELNKYTVAQSQGAIAALRKAGAAMVEQNVQLSIAINNMKQYNSLSKAEQALLSDYEKQLANNNVEIKKSQDAAKGLVDIIESGGAAYKLWRDGAEQAEKQTKSSTGTNSKAAEEILATGTAYEHAAEAARSYADVLRENLFYAINDLNGIASVSSYVIADMMSQFATGVINEAVQGFKDLGKAFADTKITSEEFLQVMGEMAKRILDMLPMLFIQAGLQLIAASQYGMGLGFVAAGISSAFVSGFVEGRQESSTNAKGNAFSNGHVEKFAQGGAFTNSIVNKPTRFNQSLMGEAGPEAVVPLTRMHDGSLGVSAGGGSAPVYVNVNNYSDAQVDVQESTGDDGSRTIEVMIKSMVSHGLGNGDYDKAMRTRYNLRSVGT